MLLTRKGNNMKTAIVKKKEVYGQTLVYPVNETAQLLAQLVGQKTLTTRTIEYGKKLGIVFEMENQTL